MYLKTLHFLLSFLRKDIIQSSYHMLWKAFEWPQNVALGMSHVSWFPIVCRCCDWLFAVVITLQWTCLRVNNFLVESKKWRHKCKTYKPMWGSCYLFPDRFPERLCQFTLASVLSGNVCLAAGCRTGMILSRCKSDSEKLLALWFLVFWRSFSNCQNTSWSVSIYFLVICRLHVNPFADTFSQLRLRVEHLSTKKKRVEHLHWLKTKMPKQMPDNPTIGSVLDFIL